VKSKNINDKRKVINIVSRKNIFQKFLSYNVTDTVL